MTKEKKEEEESEVDYEEDEEEVQDPAAEPPKNPAPAQPPGSPPAPAPVQPPGIPKVDLNEKPNRMIDDANLAAKRMEEATAAQKIENDRAEALKVETTLGGKADAGQPQEEETDEAYAKRVMNNDIEPPNA